MKILALLVIISIVSFGAPPKEDYFCISGNWHVDGVNTWPVGKPVHGWDCFVVTSLKLIRSGKPAYELVGMNVCPVVIPSVAISVKFYNAKNERIGVEYAVSAYAVSPHEVIRHTIPIQQLELVPFIKSVLVHSIKDDALSTGAVSIR